MATKLEKSYIVKVPNFEEYNPREGCLDWFRLDVRMVRSNKYRLLSPGAKHLWIWILCEVAQTRSREAYVYPPECSKEVHVRSGSIPGALLELSSLEWIRIVKAPYDTLQDVTEHKSNLALVPGGPSSPPVNQREICVVEKAEDFSVFLEQKHFDNWAKIYEIPYMKIELVKMTSWLLTNPAKNRKTRRGLTAFVGGWFNRGWDRYLNSQKSNGGGEHRSSFTGVADV